MEKDIKQEGLEFIYNDNELYCVIIRDNFLSDSVSFFTPDNFSQQLGYLPHKKGKIIKPHYHKQNKREVLYTQEVLIIKKGTLKVNLYNFQKEYIQSEVLNRGDVILLCGGGHGFEILDDVVMIEVKQGPYHGEYNDKERFEGIEKCH